MTPQEVKLWVKLRELRPAGFHFRRQVAIERFVVDFACLRVKLIVEVDGGRHSFDAKASQDQVRDVRLSALDFRIVRFWNAEVDRNLDGVVETIFAALAERSPPTPVALRAQTLPSLEG